MVYTARIPVSFDDITRDEAIDLIAGLPSVLEIVRVDPPAASADDSSFVVTTLKPHQLMHEVATAFWDEDADDITRVEFIH